MNKMSPHVEPQSYWCHVCDSRKVESTNPTTGEFFQIFGHEFHTGNYTSVFLAVCSDCLPYVPKPITR